MSKVSKADAKTISYKICEGLNKKITKLKEERSAVVTKMYVEGIPVDVMKLWKKHSEYIQATNNIQINGNGYSNWSVNLIGKHPHCSSSQYHIKWEPTREQAAIIHDLDIKIDELHNKYKTALIEIENTLLALGTWKRVEAELPSAKDYIPKSVNGVKTMALMINVAPVNEKISCLLSKEMETCLG